MITNQVKKKKKKNNGLTRSQIMSRIQIGIEFFAMRMQNFVRKEDITL